MSLEIFQFPYRQDNYGVLVHDPVSGSTACVDAGSEGAEAELAALAETGWTLSQLWITHHHPDHVAGLEALKAATGCAVFGPQGSAQPINGIDHYLTKGDRFSLGAHDVQVLHTPGHTLDMLNYYLDQDAILFSGDTLFAMGCGRIFEGTPAIMFDSMMTLKALPDQPRFIVVTNTARRTLPLLSVSIPTTPLWSAEWPRLRRAAPKGNPLSQPPLRKNGTPTPTLGVTIKTFGRG